VTETKPVRVALAVSNGELPTNDQQTGAASGLSRKGGLIHGDHIVGVETVVS
jgi:hypothetical protein